MISRQHFLSDTWLINEYVRKNAQHVCQNTNDTFFTIPVPKLFYAVYKILSAVMDENTTKKFVILEGK